MTPRRAPPPIPPGCLGARTVGGFGVGSDFAWSLNAEFEYRFNPTWSAFVGYRVFDYDYEDDGFKFDMMLHGPLIGIGWRM